MVSNPRSDPVLLDILAHMPTDFFHCSHCERFFDAAGIGPKVHQELQSAYPAEILEDASRLATWLQELSSQYGKQLHIRIVDPYSLEGFFKSLRYWARQYPTFIIDRRNKYTGWEPAVLEQLLSDRVSRYEKRV